MKQTIEEFTIRCVGDDYKVDVEHTKDTIQISTKEGDESWDVINIPAEFCDSLIEMLQKRKELMG